MTTAEIATQLVALCRDDKFVEAVDRFYADDVVSVEPADYQGGREMRGKAAVKRKNVEWLEGVTVHSFSATGPFVSPERFAVWYSFDFTTKASGERNKLNEVGVYTVVDGKITREEFLYQAA
jgi:hypothetical protein